MKILLTGHKGYIGAVAGPMLLSAGHEVVGLDADLFAGCDFGKRRPSDSGDSQRPPRPDAGGSRWLRRRAASGRIVE